MSDRSDVCGVVVVVLVLPSDRRLFPWAELLAVPLVLLWAGLSVR
jgi:hypothetical protein